MPELSNEKCPMCGAFMIVGGQGKPLCVSCPAPSMPASKATTSNPKDLQGLKKVSITKLPYVGILHGAHAMMDGATKYGPYNWREKDVIASIYVDAAFRHLGAWLEGQEEAGDSFVHHLGHVVACCAILLDAQAHGNLIDDRPGDGEVIEGVVLKIQEAIKRKAASA